MQKLYHAIFLQKDSRGDLKSSVFINILEYIGISWEYL